MHYLNDKKKKGKDQKLLGKFFAIGITIVFLSSVFVVFVQDNEQEEQREFYLAIQIKDYTNPTQGNVRYLENSTLAETLSMYNIFMNETCITTDFMYCNDGEYNWTLYINQGLVELNPGYMPQNEDQIIFKYEKQ